MSTPLPIATEVQVQRWSLATWLSLTTAGIAVLTAAVHLIGSTWHAHYLAQWDVDATVFPLSTEQTVIKGFQVVLSQWLPATVVVLKWAAVIVLAVIVVWVALAALNRLVDRWLDRLIVKLHGRKATAEFIVKPALLGLLATCGILMAMVVLAILMALPVGLAQADARSTAEARRADYLLGCALSRQRCIEVRRDGQAVAVGYLLQGSPSHLALLEASTGRSRTLAREGAEIVSARELVHVPAH